MKRSPTPKRKKDPRRKPRSPASTIHTDKMGAQKTGKNPPSEGGMDPVADDRSDRKGKREFGRHDPKTGPAQTEGERDRIRRDDGYK